ncbi:flagellar hook-length control protein FliK [Bradyrhizobium sp. Leo121]|uniref:flagellar hook-length control protein FliK n=1 Tax=Bradyrhizobium sp. Leo121 TaxID=1571195 RepID=UPI001FDF7CE7|nr:flagellar hook-length control protein FliK [Bradyrhizobium sp. Leo121]
MNKTDPLMAMIRQLTGGKAASRLAPQNAMLAKDHKGKAEDSKGDAGHFREQLRVIAQGAKQKPLDIKPQLDAKSVDMEPAQDPEPSNPLAEVLDHVAGRPKDRTRQQPRETSSHQPGGEITAPAPEWRTAEAALSSMISRLDQPLSPRDDGDAALPARSQARVEHQADLLRPGEPKSPKVDVPEQRFASSVSAIETRTLPTVKVAVREQETHFQPVGQPTLLQKIVDRIAPDLATAQAPAATTAPDFTPPDMRRGPDAPIRMLTLQLDPPSMGTVTVRMRLAGDAVEVRLLADQPETTELLRKDRGVLTDAMRSAGYTFEIASIDHSSARHPTSSGGQSHAQSDQQSSQQQPQGGSQFNNGASERQSSDAQAGTRHNRQQGHDQFITPTERRQDEEVAVDRNGGAVYL